MAKAAALQTTPVEGMTPWEYRSRVTEAVIAALSFYDSKKHKLPRVVETGKLFNAFHQLRSRYPEWLSCLYFEEQSGNYLSRGLEDVLFALGAFGLVTVENNDYRSLRINIGTKKEVEESLSIKSPNRLNDLRKMSDEFVDLVLR